MSFSSKSRAESTFCRRKTLAGDGGRSFNAKAQRRGDSQRRRRGKEKQSGPKPFPPPLLSFSLCESPRLCAFALKLPRGRNYAACAEDSPAIARSRQPFRSSLPDPSTGIGFHALDRARHPQVRHAQRREFCAQVRLARCRWSRATPAPRPSPRRARPRSSACVRPSRAGPSASWILVSTVSCGTISPAILENRDSRPSMYRNPSSSKRPRSPVRNQPSWMTSAVSSGLAQVALEDVRAAHPEHPRVVQAEFRPGVRVADLRGHARRELAHRAGPIGELHGLARVVEASRRAGCSSGRARFPSGRSLP